MVRKIINDRQRTFLGRLSFWDAGFLLIIIILYGTVFSRLGGFEILMQIKRKAKLQESRLILFLF